MDAGGGSPTGIHEGMLRDMDLDLGSGGVMLIPNTPRLVAAGKEGVMNLLDKSNLQLIQQFAIAPPWSPYGRDNYPHVHGAPVYWRDSLGTGHVYVWAQTDYLKAYSFNEASGVFANTAPASVGGVQAPANSHPGGLLSISANGTQNAIVWATLPTANALNYPASGILYAFDATNLATLWTSDQVAGDRLGYFSKNAPPTIANGKVYVSTFSNALVVYAAVPNGPACLSCTCGCNATQTACYSRSCPLHYIWDDTTCTCTQ